MHGTKPRFAVAGLLALAAFAAPRPAAATLTTIWVGAGAQCDTSSLVLAVTEASNASDDHTRIYLANDQSYTGFSDLALDYINVEIDGGYAHCLDATPTGITAIVGRSDGNVMSMFSGNESRQVTLRNLDIHGGDTSNIGGGLNISGGIYAVLDNAYVHDNHANSGAGVYLHGNGTVRPTLVLTGASLISANVAVHDGGGIECALADIVLGGVSIDYNFAGDDASSGSGGGLYLDDCTVQSAGGANFDNAIFGNHAYGGGGIFASDGSTIDLGQSGGPTRIDDNSAVSAGGGLFLSDADTRASLAATKIEANASQITIGTAIGGGVYVANSALFELDRGDRDEVCSGASPCAAMTSNIADLGSAVFASNGGRVRLSRCEIDSPGATSVASVLDGDGDGSSITLNGVLMDRLLATVAVRVTSGGAVVAANLTLAGNDVSNDFQLLGADTALNIQNSIVWDPLAIAVEGSGGVFSLNNNSFDPATLPGMNFDPGFADPHHHDFHLRGDSLNVDAYTPMAYGSTIDIDGNPRPFDLGRDNGGIFDRGAYELGDEIFADGFIDSD
ncbi:MAG: hypothetical protein WB784_09280 [Rhodanobacteraceae bacterium]